MKRYRIRFNSPAWWIINTAKAMAAVAIIYGYVVLISALA